MAASNVPECSVGKSPVDFCRPRVTGGVRLTILDK